MTEHRPRVNSYASPSPPPLVLLLPWLEHPLSSSPLSPRPPAIRTRGPGGPREPPAADVDEEGVRIPPSRWMTPSPFSRLHLTVSMPSTCSPWAWWCRTETSRPLLVAT